MNKQNLQKKLTNNNNMTIEQKLDYNDKILNLREKWLELQIEGIADNQTVTKIFNKLKLIK